MKALRNLLFALLLLASPSWAAIAVEGTPTSGDTGTGTAASLTFSHTVPSSLSNSILIVGVAKHDSGDEVTGVTYGGVSMTQVRTDNSGGTTTGCRSYLFRLLNPTAGTADVVVSVSPNRRFTAGAITFSGVDQTTPFGTLTGANSGSGGTTGPATVDVTTTTDDLVVDVVCKRDSAETLTVGADQTSRWTDATTSGTTASNVLGGGSTEPHNTGTTTMSWSWTSATRLWSISAGPLLEAGGAPAAAASRRVIVIQ